MPETKTLNRHEELLQSVRRDFPILKEQINGQDLVYLDNAATSQKPQIVIDALTEYYTHVNSNVHRGVHRLSQKATMLYEGARKKVQEFINAAYEEEIVITGGTTDSINLAAHALSELLLVDGGEVLTTEMEHHSNFVPWQMLAQMYQCKFNVAAIRDDGSLDMQDFGKKLSKETRIVAISHASNTLGTINDIRKISEMAHEVGAVVVVDGAQYVPHLKLDIQEMGCDLYAFSAHKAFGPTGIGVLYGKKSLLEKMPPYKYGGGMIGEVKIEETSFGKTPHIFEAGTPHIAGAYGMGVALEYMEKVGFDFIESHEKALLEYATEKLSAIPGLKMFGTAENKVSVLSFNIEDCHPFDLGTLLDQMGIAVRTGHHCTMPIMQRFDIPGTVRIGLAFYNTLEEVDKLHEGIQKAISILK